MPGIVTVHRFETAVELAGSGVGSSAGGSTEKNMAAMTEEEQLAYALSLSMMPEQPKVDAASAAAESEAAAAAAPVEEPLFDAHHDAGVTGHVSLRPGAFIRVQLGQNVPVAPEATKTSQPGGASGYGGTRVVYPNASASGGRAGRTSHDSWTISMDIRLAALPQSDPIPLLSCSADTGTSKGTSELYVYPNGAVTVFDEEPTDPRTMLNPGVWTRITVRFGKTLESNDKRVLSVFVNGKKSITDMHKYDFIPNGGRFSIPTAGFLLFAGKDPYTMPGVDVRYVEFTNRCLTETEVRVSKSQSIYRQFESAAPDDEIRQALALQPL
jgi:hypothetical protein